MKILFINVPWMKYYVGEGDEEKVTPACGYNFQNFNGKYYGYGEGLETIEIENLEGVSPEDKYVEDVTIVWTARNRDNQNKIIGWYKKARVYRTPLSSLSLDSERTLFTYSFVARVEDSLLLPVELRLLDVKDTEEGVSFESDEKVIQDVAMYIHNYGGDQMNYVFAKKDLEGQSILNFSEYEMYFAKADEFLAKDLYGKAMRCFNKAIATEPELAVGYECKGSVLLSLKMHSEALEVYKKVVELEAENEQAHYCLGLLYGLTEQYDRCLTHLNYYIEKRPKDMNAIAERGIALYNLGEIEKAKVDFERAYESESEHPVFCKLKEYVNKSIVS